MSYPIPVTPWCVITGAWKCYGCGTEQHHCRQALAQAHFDSPLEFLDLFLPINLSSASRARAFLWLMFHYLSSPGQLNPFDDDYSRAHPGKVPFMTKLSKEEMARENQDPPDEIEWGRKMSAMRGKFLRELVDEMEMEKKRKKHPPPPPPPVAPMPTFSGNCGSVRGRVEVLTLVLFSSRNRGDTETSYSQEPSVHVRRWSGKPRIIPRPRLPLFSTTTRVSPCPKTSSYDAASR